MAPSREGESRYAASGVDLEAAGRLKRAILEHARSTHGGEVVGPAGFFGGAYRLAGYRDPVLVSSVDGVGTKLKVAAAAGAYEGVGRDVVNHGVNDVLATGARPLFFMDYLAMGRLEAGALERLVAGMADACRAAGCALLGGETAEMPGVYLQGETEVAGFMVGAVERERLLDGSAIMEGYLLVALPSSGPHTNGFSLLRRVLGLDARPEALDATEPSLGATLGEAVLAVHRPYYPLVEPVLPMVKGMAHVTGGGLPGNVPRVLPEGLAARVDRSSWRVPPLFSLVQERGGVSEEEMFRVFNMGVGMVLATGRKMADSVIAALGEGWVCGEVVRHDTGPRVVLA